jgi:hypothetical protein
VERARIPESERELVRGKQSRVTATPYQILHARLSLPSIGLEAQREPTHAFDARPGRSNVACVCTGVMVGRAEERLHGYKQGEN